MIQIINEYFTKSVAIATLFLCKKIENLLRGQVCTGDLQEKMREDGI